MDPKRGSVWLAPGSNSGALHFPEPSQRLSVEEHLVEPEVTRDEIVGGERVYAAPANPEHGDPHFRLDAVLAANVRPGYQGSTDLLTRQAEDSDFATDTCIRKAGNDPATGERYREEFAVEIANEEREGHVTKRARILTKAGVRRVLAIFVHKREVREWSVALGAWVVLDRNSEIVDPVLARPVRVAALLDAGLADEELLRGLLAKNSPALNAVLEAAPIVRSLVASAEHSAALQGRAEALLVLLRARGFVVSAETEERVRACTESAQLEQWVLRAATANALDAVFSGA